MMDKGNEASSEELGSDSQESGDETAKFVLDNRNSQVAPTMTLEKSDTMNFDARKSLYAKNKGGSWMIKT